METIGPTKVYVLQLSSRRPRRGRHYLSLQLQIIKNSKSTRQRVPPMRGNIPAPRPPVGRTVSVSRFKPHNSKPSSHFLTFPPSHLLTFSNLESLCALGGLCVRKNPRIRGENRGTLTPPLPCHIQRVLPQIPQLHILQRRFMRRLQYHQRRLSRQPRFLPSLRTDTPPIPRLQSRKTILWPWRR